MTKHTIVIELDVLPGMESAVHDKAYSAIQLLNDYRERHMAVAHDGANMIAFVCDAESKHFRPQAAQQVIDKLKAQARRIYDSTEIVKLALSEIRHAMSIADTEYRRKQAQETT